MGLMRGLVLIAGLAVAWLAASTTSQAATVTVNFTGTIQNLFDPLGLTTFSNSDAISGILTIGPMADAPTTNVPPPAAGTVYTSAANFAFAPISGPGQASITTQNIVSAIGYFGIQFQTPTSGLLIDFTVANPTAVPLQSLTNLPTDLASVLSYLGGTLLSSDASIYGGPDLAHQFSFDFHLDSLSLSATPLATTPIPPALLLFLTALGGLGFFARRDVLRRKPSPDALPA